FDILLSFITLYLAYALRFNFEIPSGFINSFFIAFSVLLPLKLFFLWRLKLYFVVWRFFSLSDGQNLLKAHLYMYASFTLIFLLFPSLFEPFPRSVIIIDFALSLLFLGSLRIFKRLLIEKSITSSIKKTIIIGANAQTASIIKSALNQDIAYYPVCIVTSSPEEESAVGTYINSIKVHKMEELEDLIKIHEVEAAIITAKLDTPAYQSLFDTLSHSGINEIKKSKILGDQHEKLLDLSIEDLLARYPKDLDSTKIASFIKEKCVLITGAGGSIGSEIALQCEYFGAKSLILLDHSEFNLYQIGEKLPHTTLKLCSVLDNDALESLFKSNSVDIVIHAAAYKHVPLCELNQKNAIENNVLGTKNVIDYSIAHNISKVVIISTDKAVRPSNVMGTTKRIGELYAQNVDSQNTEIVAVRFGNVLGSSGSVIPKFKSQIENGGPITVTHPEITRYFMMIPEACQLVLQAASIAKGGELFILDMGESIKIVDLASQMIKLYGKEKEIEIVFSGLRPGEKLYEELLIDE
ncbi:MAG: nucleoside-diphosphate sugar epimerase/dehydratase, partial [Campylobacterota bacterium]|nr:nucleoside-diphosphate sugar epimerase/dehydratase [Campylobacterota bacterium]